MFRLLCNSSMRTIKGSIGKILSRRHKVHTYDVGQAPYDVQDALDDVHESL